MFHDRSLKRLLPATAFTALATLSGRYANAAPANATRSMRSGRRVRSESHPHNTGPSMCMSGATDTAHPMCWPEKPKPRRNGGKNGTDTPTAAK